MTKKFRISTDNFDGFTADITYYPYTGGTINLGTQMLPYDYNTDYFYGTYEVYIPYFDKICIIDNQPPVCDLIGSFTSPFISTWKTDNEGVSLSNQIFLNLDSSGTYNFVVDWGDGSSDEITTWDQP